MRIENKRDARDETPHVRRQAKHMREDRAADEAKRKPQAVETGTEARKPSARAVLTSSPQTTADNRGERDDAQHVMTARTHTYNIMATAQSRTNRTIHERERPSDKRRHGYNGASKQSTPSR